MSIFDTAAQPQATDSRLYRAVWRWHFYAGLYVIPFLLMLAITGLIMLYAQTVESQLGHQFPVITSGQRIGLEVQAKAAAEAVPGGAMTGYVQQRERGFANTFVITGADNKEHVVAVDPNTGKVVGSVIKDDTLFYWARAIHGSFLVGQPSEGWGDHLIEAAAGLAVVLVITGLYMWWPRGERSFASALIPDLSRSGRVFWKEVHVTAGAWISILLLFFLLSGLAWTGIWGGKWVQPWNTFPAQKWGVGVSSDVTHAALNHGALKEVPWALEQTPMPISGSLAGAKGIEEGKPVNLDSVVAFARGFGFDEQFRVTPPRDDKGVWTVTADSMNSDTSSPFRDRTIHIDQYTGKVLANVGYNDYPIGGKAMAVSIALHEGGMGLWNLAFNTVYCLFIITLCISGVVMWWVRRPAKALGSPLYVRGTRVPVGVLVLGVLLCIAFPLAGVAICIFATVDFFLPKRLKEAGIKS